MTLHDEIAAILRERGNPWMTTAELAEIVNARGAYKKRDGSEVTAFQVHGRTRKYETLFERDGSNVRLRIDLAGRPTRRTVSRQWRRPAVAGQVTDEAPLDQVLAALSQHSAQAVGTANVAARPGLYAVFGSVDVWRELGLGEPPDGRPLYVGKAEDSLVKRDLRTHFESGRTGQSTLRRSLAALLSDQLDLVPMPRNPRSPADFDRYGLEAAGDARLTRWMREHLSIAAWSPDGPALLGLVETRVLAHLQPPLNLSKVTTGWSGMVSAARARMAGRARTWPRGGGERELG